MTTNPVTEFLEQLRRHMLPHEGPEPTDAQLLGEFLRRSDRQALEVLVRRHAAMVWGVCRRKLSNAHDAEDAFQATFLVLLRRAASIRSRELLANWLYRVAHTTVCKAGQVTAKRAAREKPLAALPEPTAKAPDDQLGPELHALLDEEVSRLPDRYRIAVVLCDLEGRSRPEVAQQLGLPDGTVASRLARGRALLAKRLARRGVGVSATSLAAVVAQQAASGAVPADLLASTIKITTAVAAGDLTAAGALSAQVSALAEGVLKTMRLAKLKAAGFGFLLAALVLAGGLVTNQVIASRVGKGGDRTPLPDPGIVGGMKNGDGLPGVGPDLDFRQYGSPALLMERAVEILAARETAIPGLPEVLQQWTEILFRDYWKEPAGKRSADRIPPHLAKLQPWLAEVQPGHTVRTFVVDAKLDRKTGEWTVIGVVEFGGPPPNRALEIDWKYVARYTPAGTFEDVAGPFFFGPKGVKTENLLEVLKDGPRYGLRPVR
jgi:RNA polymerase sigma factor (sigma-70 family)